MNMASSGVSWVYYLTSYSAPFKKGFFPLLQMVRSQLYLTEVKHDSGNHKFKSVEREKTTIAKAVKWTANVAFLE